MASIFIWYKCHWYQKRIFTPTIHFEISKVIQIILVSEYFSDRFVGKILREADNPKFMLHTMLLKYNALMYIYSQFIMLIIIDYY